jgi:hypothetical protein
MDDDKDEIKDYADQYDNSFRVKPRLRSLMSRGSRPVAVEEFDEELGEWRTKVKMTRVKMDDRAKGAFLEEYAKWGRMGESAQAAGVSSQSIRKALEDDEDFAAAMLIAEEHYRDKLIGHHQDLVFNGQEKNTYGRDGSLISTERIYPIRLIELELKKHDSGYRDKQEVAVSHSGGVLVAPAEMGTIEAWEKNFTNMVDVTPKDEEE